MKSYFSFINEKYTHKELNEKFWTDLKFDEGVREKVLEIAKDFYETLDNVDLEIDDIHLTGSIANYNYHPDSDLDIHILVDFDEYEGDKEILVNMIQSKSFIWNLKHDINIRGADVELYVQDKNEEHISTGLYSMQNGEWIKKPKYSDPDVDDDSVNSKYKRWVYEIDEISKTKESDLSDEDKRERYDRAEKLKLKLKKFRKTGLNDKGEYSVENVTFKKLRNDGHIEKLYKSSTEFYDSIFSQ